jgi:hypothetical protein
MIIPQPAYSHTYLTVVRSADKLASLWHASGVSAAVLC